MNISVIGCGYLGAVHAACMASLGHTVVGIDTNKERVDALAQGIPPFHEPGFEELLAEQIASGRLSFTTNADEVDFSSIDVHFLAVGTPQKADSHAADLSYLWSVVDMLITKDIRGALLVGKSTVPVGTAQQIADTVEPYGATLMWNPEFLREGFAIKDTLHPDRIVYGLPADENRAARAKSTLDAVYAALLEEEIPLLTADYATAELVKVAANAFLATKISFINAMAEICESTGGDVTILADAIGHDPRIGRRFLGAGIGFGGGCLPKDIRAFVARAEELGNGESVSFLRQVDAINGRRRSRVIDLSHEMLGKDLSGARVAVLGAAFKPNSDDIRDSPALDVATRLHEAGADVVVTDPKALPAVAARYPQLRLEKETTTALKDADLVILATEWDEYATLNATQVAGLTRQSNVIDARNVLNHEQWRSQGWNLRGLGR
ncbi:UDP-glucose dehydrogenase family protein [Schaalia suimastitidis]|uniref:UDP-glucose dehydrogenase family protein n=1 Tax=Schaalia suimastitidis TaxID=121163 RepID=UPI0004208666|nr:UDP-glucose/GDP-mannose dehydrogenase family protein [Schaalia suimastitidis]